LIQSIDFTGDIHPTRLGAWDLEKTAEKVAIAGKKMFTLFNSEHERFNGPNPIYKKNDKSDPSFKLSSKGGTMTLKDILSMCEGGSIQYDNPAPTFSLKRPTRFVKRNFTKTVDDGAKE
jgi:hypothetical protein